MRNVLSVDLEEYFHPTELESAVRPEDWERLESRVEDNTRRTLELLARHKVRATFFVLGWVGERHPALIRDIAAAGHEIGCHSYGHRLVYRLTREEFLADTRRAQEAIAAACGVTPRLYRAPSYSITRASFWALETLAACGFTHDSSIYPIAHDRYGIPGFSRQAVQIPTAAGPILEVPPAAAQLSPGRVAPVGGGGYLRLLPYRYTAAGIRRINRDDGQPACLYIHPWEIDPGIPRLLRKRLTSWRTYAGLASMEGKLDRLLSEFAFAPLGEVHPARA